MGSRLVFAASIVLLGLVVQRALSQDPSDSPQVIQVHGRKYIIPKDPLLGLPAGPSPVGGDGAAHHDGILDIVVNGTSGDQRLVLQVYLYSMPRLEPCTRKVAGNGRGTPGDLQPDSFCVSWSNGSRAHGQPVRVAIKEVSARELLIEFEGSLVSDGADATRIKLDRQLLRVPLKLAVSTSPPGWR